jgi:Flp pilus assembly protein TadG
MRKASRPRSLLGERGAVSAELAVALPAVVVVVMLGVGALGAGARQVRLQDAAADAARLIARGEGVDRAAAVVALAGGTATIDDSGELVCVRASAPAPLALPLPPLTARSCALGGGL